MDKQERIVALYCRYSGEEDNNGNGSNSINNQQLLLKTFALENNLKPIEIYADDGYSGTMFDRPDFQRMIRDIENGTVGTVIVKDMSRFGRNHVTVGLYTDEFFVKHKIRFISICDGIDTAVKSDDLAPFRNITNEMYAKDISKKTKASIYAKGKSGQKMIATPIYGYKYDENKNWEIDETAAKVVRRVFDLFLKGYGAKKIADIFTKEGITKPSVYKFGNKASWSKYPDWSRESIVSMLKHQEYVGDTVNFKTVRPSYKSKQKVIRPKEENMVFYNTHPAIISREQFEDVQALLAKRTRQYSNKRLVDESLFHGLLTCPDCGCKLAAYHKERNYGIYTQYVCQTYRRFEYNKHCTSHSINEKVLIQLITDSLKELIELYSKGELAKWLNKILYKDLKKEQLIAQEQLDEIKSKISESDTVIKNLYKDKLNGEIPNDVFLELYNQFKEEQSELQARFYELTTKLNDYRDSTTGINRFLKIIKKYSESETITLSRENILELIDYIVVCDKFDEGAKHRHIDIYFKYVGLLQ